MWAYRLPFYISKLIYWEYDSKIQDDSTVNFSQGEAMKL